jgi:hypothetical protein
MSGTKFDTVGHDAVQIAALCSSTVLTLDRITITASCFTDMTVDVFDSISETGFPDAELTLRDRRDAPANTDAADPDVLFLKIMQSYEKEGKTTRGTYNTAACQRT